MKLKIKNLFGYRNYDLELNDKINILIGENGSGKSTILKIINALLNEDLITLSQIDFEEINVHIEFDDEIKLIEHKNNIFYEHPNLNLIIKKKEIVPLEYVRDIKFKNIMRCFLEKYDFDKDIEDIQLNFHKFMNEFRLFFVKNKTDKYKDFSIKVNIEEDEEIFLNINKKSFNKINPLDEPTDCTEDELKSTLFCQLMRNVPYGSEMYFYNLYLLFIRLKIISKYKFPLNNVDYYFRENIRTKLSLRNCFLLSDLAKYNKENISIHYEGFIIKNKKDYYTLLKFDNNAEDIDKERILLMYDNYNPLRIFCALYGGKYDNSIDDYVKYNDSKEYKILLSKRETVIRLIKDLTCELNRKPLEKQEICFNYHSKYSAEDLKKIKKIFNYLKVHLDKININENEKTKEKYDDYIEIYKNNVNLKNAVNILKELGFTREDFIEEISNNFDNIFNFDEDKLIFKFESKLNYIYNYLPYIFSIEEIMEKAKKINIRDYQDSDEVNCFFKFTEEYLRNKKVLVYYDDLEKINFDIFDINSNKLLDVNQISSGESKILRLSKNITLVEKNIVLMDEPDLSLSIYWQKSLIENFIKYSKVNKIIIATQSICLINENQIKYLKEVTWK